MNKAECQLDFLNKREFIELYIQALCDCVVFARFVICVHLLKYLGTSIWLFLNVYLKLLGMGVSEQRTFQSLKAVSKNAL